MQIRTPLRTRTFLFGALFLLGIGGAGYSGYYVGYTKGAADLLAPPLGLINTHTIAEPLLALSDPGQTEDFSNFWKTWYILEKNFAPASTTEYSASTSRARLVGAIGGLAQSYEDPYTVFIPKQEAEHFKEQVNGEFEGIGAALSIEEGITRVTGILPHSPAEAAGLTRGDSILAVDGISTSGLELESIIPHIRGPKGTTVTLHVASQQGAPRDVVITRAAVAIPTTATRVVSASKAVVAAAVAKAESAAAAAGAAASSLFSDEQEIAAATEQEFFILQLVQFAKTSVDAFVADLERFSKSKTPYLIIDLRNNPGGFLEVAVDLASYFLPKDTLVVSQRSGATSQETLYRSSGHELLTNIHERRIVIIMNKNSASASEILAGALQDHGIAKIVGEKSFGKGSVQTLVDIGDLGSLKVTISRWYTPNGRNISHEGIAPDIVVDVTDPKFASSTDPFIDAATEALLDDTLWKK